MFEEVIEEDDMCIYHNDDYDNSNDHFDEFIEEVEEEEHLKQINVYDKPGNKNKNKYNHYIQCIHSNSDYIVAILNIIDSNNKKSNHILCIWPNHHTTNTTRQEYLSLDKVLYTTMNHKSSSIDNGLNDNDEKSMRFNDISVTQLTDSMVLVVVGVINNNIKKWSFNINNNDNNNTTISLCSFIQTNASGNVTTTTIASNTGRIATSENTTTIGVRTDDLRCIRTFNPFGTTTTTTRSGTRITGLGFLDNDGDKVVACYSSGLVIGYDIINDTIIFEYNSDTNNELLRMIVFNDFIDINNNYNTTTKRNIIIAFHDGKLRHLEVDINSNNVNEIQSVDMQKTMRYSLKKADNDTTYQDIHNDKATTITKQSSQIAIPLGLCLINPSISTSQKESMMMINECRISVATSSAIIILTLNPFKVISSFPIEGKEKNFSASTLQYISNKTAVKKKVSSSGLYSDMEYDDDDNDILKNQITGYLTVVMISSFSGLALQLRYPFLKDSSGTVKKTLTKSRLPLREVKRAVAVATTATDKKLEVSTSRYIDNPNLPLSFFAHQCSEDEGKSLLHNVKPIDVETPIIHRGCTARTDNKVYLKGGQWEAPGKDKKGKLIDQPVTFHKVIKSSGYGQVPNNILDKKRLDRQRRLLKEAAEKQRSSSAAASLGSGKRLRQYPVNCDLINIHQEDHDLPARSIPFPISQLSFSEDASMLGVAITDSSVLTLKLPVSRYNGAAITYLGHNKRVNNVTFSHDNSMILSSSADCTARLWSVGKTDSSAVIFSHCSKQPSSGVGKTSTIVNKAFTEEIKDSSFYYLDKFVVLSCSSAIMMYTYEPEGTDAKNDLKRLQSNGKYKCVHKWSGDSHSFSTLSCINSVKSPFLLAATSDYKLMVLDTEVGGVARTIDSPHEKAIHSIALPRPSAFAQVASTDCFNYFATAASDNSVNIWDIRVPRCTGRYTNHLNRREEVQVCLSPCLRYLSVGSEDKTCRIVDLRSGKELAKLQGFKDVVAGCSFNPLFPQLAVGSFDGQIKFFSC